MVRIDLDRFNLKISIHMTRKMDPNTFALVLEHRYYFLRTDREGDMIYDCGSTIIMKNIIIGILSSFKNLNRNVSSVKCPHKEKWVPKWLLSLFTFTFLNVLWKPQARVDNTLALDSGIQPFWWCLLGNTHFSRLTQYWDPLYLVYQFAVITILNKR